MLIFGLAPTVKPKRVGPGRTGRPLTALRRQYGDLEVVADSGKRRNSQRVIVCRCLRCGAYCERRLNTLNAKRVTEGGEPYNMTCGCTRVKRDAWWAR